MLCLCGTFLFNFAVLRENIDTSILGAAMRGVLPTVFSARAMRPERRWDQSPGDWRGITPQNYAMTGASVDPARISGAIDLKFMTPDVGGAALCCERLGHSRFGAFTNPTLARRGYARLAEYLNKDAPKSSRRMAYGAATAAYIPVAEFEMNYCPAIYNGTLFWWRHDVLQRLVARGLAADPVRLDRLPNSLSGR